ncbi:MAG: HDOD domain-containing protein [Zetaproteobacteria bacterium]|nr:HDOD domain-containing protein [Zetaproteobacteria bacterium]
MPDPPALEKVCGKCKRTFFKQDDYLTSTSRWRVCSNGNLWFNCKCGSTLMLPRGYYNWYSPELAIRGSQRNLFQQFFARNSLPHIPAAVMEVQSLLADPDTEIKELVAAVKSDPLLATEVVSVFECKQRVRRNTEGQGTVLPKKARLDLAYAITYIGMNQLASMVLVAALRKFEISTQVFDPEVFWRESRRVGIISEHIWCKVDNPNGKDRAYVAGSLCNIGKLVVALGYPDQIDALVRYLADPSTQTTWVNAEKILGAHDHRVLGEVGAAFWGFPLWVVECIRGHQGPTEDIAQEYQKLVWVVGLANILHHWVNLEPHRFREEDLLYFRQNLNLSAVDVEALVDRVKCLNEADIG